MLTNDLIIVTIDSSKITFITYKLSARALTDQQFKQKSQKNQRDILEDFQEVELEPKFLRHGPRFRISDFSSN